MSSWAVELGFLRRYAGSGVVNTAIGVSIILALTGLGLQPYLANAIGYAAGLVSSFLLSRFYTFRSQGAIGRETLRFVMAFAVAYAANLGTLHVWLKAFPASPVVGQLVATVAYTGTMYLISRVFVFTPRKDRPLVNSDRPGT